MFWVVGALVPGLAVQTWFFGTDVVVRAIVAVGMALLAEATCLRLRQRPLQRNLSDGSAVVTALLISAAVPPSASFYALGVAVVTAIGLGKHAYGGLGQNIFNPAMVGYAVALVSLPAEFANWPIDGTTGATALDALKHNDGLTTLELQQTPPFGTIGGWGWEWINVAFLAGGGLLALKQIIAWRVPLTFLGVFAVLAVIFDDGGSSQSLGGPLLHLTTGGIMLTAWFIATDPVTHPARQRPQLIFAAIAAATAFTIRAWGAYPDGLAFGILLANAATPYIDRRFG